MQTLFVLPAVGLFSTGKKNERSVVLVVFLDTEKLVSSIELVVMWFMIIESRKRSSKQMRVKKLFTRRGVYWMLANF